ncbi:hypothetical protein WY02_27035 [Pseudonocardia sp. AL041005-10]|nr:hypothetical protein WY02_27035 [Pseudonocardia sp. AL041005-10]
MSSACTSPAGEVRSDRCTVAPSTVRPSASVGDPNRARSTQDSSGPATAQIAAATASARAGANSTGRSSQNSTP